MICLTSTSTNLPKKAHLSDAAADIVATSITFDGKYIEYGTNLKMLPPDGYFGAVFPRSSISNYDLILANSVGVIDDYTGEWKIRFKRVKQPLLTLLYSEVSRLQQDYGDACAIYSKLKFYEIFKKHKLNFEIERLKHELRTLDKQIQITESFEKLYKIGDKIAQFTFLPKSNWTYQVVDVLPETTRGEGGFGSTTTENKSETPTKSGTKKKSSKAK